MAAAAGSPSAAMSTHELLPGWSNRALLDDLISAHRPGRISLRSTAAALCLAAAGLAFALAVWVGVRYATVLRGCTDAAARYADGSLYCEATPTLSSSGLCSLFRGEPTLDVCLRHSPVHPDTAFGLAALGFLLLFVAALFAAWWWVARRSVPPFVGLLTRRARDVCWVYVRETRYVRHGFTSGRASSVILTFTNRQFAEIGPLSAGDAMEALRSVVPLVPWATIGHTPTAAAAYERDPRSLLRGA